MNATIYRFQALQTAVTPRSSNGDKAHVWLSQAEVFALMNTVTGGSNRDWRDRVSLALLVGAGLRRDEAVNLEFANVRRQPIRKKVRTVLQAGFTITGVVVDADYGANAAFRAGLERLGLAYGVAIRGEAVFTVPDVGGPLSAIALADSAPDDAWETVTWGTGTAGPLTADFCALRVRPTAGRGDRWLLCERSATDERKYYLVHLPATAALADLVALARSRWPIEQQYRELKSDLGLDHFEGRTYPGWTHHVVLTAVAFTFLQIERGRVTDDPRPTLPVVRGWVREIMGLLYVLHNRRLLEMLDSFRRDPPLRR